MPAPPVPAAEAARQRAQRLRMRRRLTAAIFALPLLLLASALYLYFGPKPPPPPLVLPVTLRQAAQATERVDAVRQALTEPMPPPPPAATKAADTPPPTTPIATARPVHHVRGPQGEDLVTMELSETDLNAYLSGNPQMKAALEKRGVHTVSVELTPPAGMVFHANATLKGLTGNALVAGTLTPDPRTAIQLAITDARFGRLPPPVVKAAAAEITRQLITDPHRPLPINVRNVEVRGTDLILTGVENKPFAADSSPHR